MTRSRDVISNACFVSTVEPKNVKEALTDECWINAMREELNEFKRNEVWDLVPRPDRVNIIGTKWVYRNKSDESGVVTRNKARLVAQGYSQIEDSRLTGYCDADWAGCANDRKSTSGGCFFLGNNLISWFSKKPNCVALSTAEAEYIAA
ncbi:hypothetical protein QL285_021150 [Trifolium repens]|nr:hypothetical protein QL285_021150 [Trifolium repens]